MRLIILASAAAAALLPAAANAQIDPYVGIGGGYHDFDHSGPQGALVGGYAGVNVPLGQSPLVVGVEGNAYKGFKDLDHEYGVTGHVGVRGLDGKGMIFARGGYEWVKTDFGKTDRKIWGVGAEYAPSKIGFRVNADTLDFESVRVTGGVSYHF